MVPKLSEWSGLFIMDPDFLPIPDPGVKMAPRIPDPPHCRFMSLYSVFCVLYLCSAAIKQNAGSGSALNQYESETVWKIPYLIKWKVARYRLGIWTILYSFRQKTIQSSFVRLYKNGRQYGTVRINIGFGSNFSIPVINTGKTIRQIHPYRLKQAKFYGKYHEESDC